MENEREREREREHSERDGGQYECERDTKERKLFLRLIDTRPLTSLALPPSLHPLCIVVSVT